MDLCPSGHEQSGLGSVQLRREPKLTPQRVLPHETVGVPASTREACGWLPRDGLIVRLRDDRAELAEIVEHCIIVRVLDQRTERRAIKPLDQAHLQFFVSLRKRDLRVMFIARGFAVAGRPDTCLVQRVSPRALGVEFVECVVARPVQA